MPVLPVFRRNRLLPAFRIQAVLALGICLASALPGRAHGEPVTVLAAGDIAFCERGWGRQLKDWFTAVSGEPGAPATAALLDRLPGTLLIMGDLVYWDGTAEEFDGCYDASWGRHKDRSRPTPGGGCETGSRQWTRSLPGAAAR